jgi:hypothetical protein
VDTQSFTLRSVVHGACVRRLPPLLLDPPRRPTSSPGMIPTARYIQHPLQHPQRIFPSHRLHHCVPCSDSLGKYAAAFLRCRAPSGPKPAPASPDPASPSHRSAAGGFYRSPPAFRLKRPAASSPGFMYFVKFNHEAIYIP